MLTCRHANGSVLALILCYNCIRCSPWRNRGKATRDLSVLFCNFLQTNVLNELLVKTLDQCLSKHLINISLYYYDFIVIIPS